jgi:integrase
LSTAAIVAEADAQGLHSVGTAIVLNEWCSQREGDVLNFKKPSVAGGTITLRQSKTGADVALPVEMVPALAARIAAELARHKERGLATPYLIVCESTRRAWQGDHFRHTFSELRRTAARRAEAAGDTELAADIRPRQFMDLRHTAVTRLAEAGATEPLIAAVTGHSLQAVRQILSHYLIRTEEQAREAFKRRLEAEQKRGTVVTLRD